MLSPLCSPIMPGPTFHWEKNLTICSSIVKLREDSWLSAKFAVVIQELFNVLQKLEAYADRSLIDLFTAKVRPAKAHTFAKKYCRDWLFAHLQSLKVQSISDYTGSLQGLNKSHFTGIIARELRSLFFLGARKKSSTKAAQLAIFCLLVSYWQRLSIAPGYIDWFHGSYLNRLAGHLGIWRPLLQTVPWLP